MLVRHDGRDSIALGISMARGERPPSAPTLLLALLLCFFAFGLSIAAYILAQRELGAARTSAWYAAAPFIGVALSWLLLHEPVTWRFVAALAIMLAGAWFAVTESHPHTPDLHHRHGHS